MKSQQVGTLDSALCNRCSITPTGPPDDITDINISPDTITACSFVVQWSKPSSDPVCGSVWYTVTISTEGGILIITDNTTMTNYNVTGLNDNTVYHVTVIASNNAGSSNVASMMIMTNSNGKLFISNCVYVCTKKFCGDEIFARFASKVTFMKIIIFVNTVATYCIIWYKPIKHDNPGFCRIFIPQNF